MWSPRCWLVPSILYKVKQVPPKGETAEAGHQHSPRLRPDLTVPGAQPAAAQPHPGHPPDRLGEDRPAHLRAALRSLAEDDRHLDHAEALFERAIGRLDLEGVAARADRVEVDRLQDPAVEDLEAAGEIADPD